MDAKGVLDIWGRTTNCPVSKLVKRLLRQSPASGEGEEKKRGSSAPLQNSLSGIGVSLS